MVDVFADVIGVSSSAVWVEAFRSEVEAALRQEFGAEATTIVWRRSDGRLQQDGWKGTGATTDAAGRGDSPVGLEVAAACPTAGFEGDGGRAGGAWDENVGGGGKKRGFRDDVPATVVRELGLEYEVRPQFGQKTGEGVRRACCDWCLLPVLLTSYTGIDMKLQTWLLIHTH